MALANFLADLRGLWEIQEIRIFFWVAFLGILLYFLLINARKIFRKTLGKADHAYHHVKHKASGKAFLYKSRKENRWEIYREWVANTETPLVVWIIPRTMAERCIYGLVILLLFGLIIWRMMS